MPISDCWNVDEPNKRIQHVDGRLAYNSNTGTAPVKYDWIRGATSGAVGQIINGDDLGGTNATGYFDLTNVVGQFSDTEEIVPLDSLHFDTVDNGGFVIGNTLTGPTTESFTVYAIEYNLPTDATAGEGYAYGTINTAGFAENEQIDVSGGTSAVALVHTNAETSGATFDGNVNGNGIDVPGTSNTNDSVIIHYDAGAIAIPEESTVSDASSGAYGLVQQVYGDISTGSLRLVDSNTTGGSWTNNNGLQFEDVIFYDTLQTGYVFSVGDVVTGGTSSEQARVVGIVDDGDNSGKLITAGKTGVFTNGEDLNVGGTKIAQVENTTTVLACATLNLPSGVRTVQRASQGGLYHSTRASLNIVRSSNAFYSYIADVFDELGYLDDDFPLTGDFKNLVYTIENDYYIPDLSLRFLENGAFRDAGNQNIWTNIQFAGTLADVGNHGFLYDSSNPTPRPNLYIEQDGDLVDQFWLEGPINVNIKVKTSTDPAYISAGLEGLGQLIDNGYLNVYAREYFRTYDHFPITKVGQIQVAALSTSVDSNNTTGQYRCAFTSGSGTPFTVGEEITTTTGKVGIVTYSDSGASGNVDYILKSATNFVNTDGITGAVSAATATVGDPSNLVAGYGSDVRVMTVTDEVSGGTTAGTWIPGEPVTQATTGATGWFLTESDANAIYLMKNNATAFSGNNTITGGTSSATYSGTLSYDANQDTVPCDLGDGSGEENYTAYIAADITGADPQPILNVYEWTKFLTRKESTTTLGGPGNATGTEGRFYQRLVSTFELIKLAPFGTFAGGKMLGAQGVFIDKDTLATADLQNFTVKNNAGTTRTPPNLQVMEIINIFSGVRAAAYRTATLGGEIQRTEFKVGAVGGGYNQSGDANILVAAQDRSVSPLPSDVPGTGVIRVLDPNDTGRYLSFIYDSVNRTSNYFHLQQGIGQNTIGAVTSSTDLVANDNAHVVFIQEEASGTSVNNTIQYVSNIFLYVVARKKGYRDFNTTATFTNTGASVGANLLADGTVNLP